MNKDFLSYLDTVAHGHGIDRDTLISHLEEAVAKAAKKAVSHNREMTVHFDRTSGSWKCQAKLFVVETVKLPSDEISLDEARTRLPEAKIGDEVEWEVDTREFGRIAAMTAKQEFTLKTRTTEKKNVCELFREQLMQLVTGEVRRVDREGIFIEFPAMNAANGAVEGLLRRDQKLPGENFEVGDIVTALLTEINADKPGPALYVSRSDPAFVAKLFEREVSEIAENLVVIKAVSRDPGYRSKIAVTTSESRIDPVGACVGVRGTRVRTIVRELGGEKVDIIEWSPDVATYVANALKPAKLQTIKVDEDTHTVKIQVAEDQLSLAIGKKGQNARLAYKLTGWKIDIQKQEVQEVEDDYTASVRRAKESIGAIEAIGPEAADVLVDNGFVSLEGIAPASVEDLAGLPGFDEAKAAAVIEAAKAALM